MRIVKLDTRNPIYSGDNDFPGKGHVPSRLPYQIVVSYRCDRSQHVEELILSQLQQGFEQGYQLGIRLREHQPMIDFTVSLACNSEERAAVVRLVTRLGLEKDVRSVRWQSVPESRR